MVTSYCSSVRTDTEISSFISSISLLLKVLLMFFLKDQKRLFQKFKSDSTKRINFVLEEEPKQFFVLLFFYKPNILKERAPGGLVLCGLF